ncbi:uncharacterized protein LOC120352897 [Nilaparvata lugens]|uniref:uncharacterized protein LOC120352897 n=1 Tax=Nilaparvata lugens TaxID=108931 RepID=UPI00193DCAA4|nr:uncharacterized protein LOC120352897 [Nilaparvata lugens]
MSSIFANSTEDYQPRDNLELTSPVREFPEDMDDCILRDILGDSGDDSDKDPTWEPIDEQNEKRKEHPLTFIQPDSMDIDLHLDSSKDDESSLCKCNILFYY